MQTRIVLWIVVVWLGIGMEVTHANKSGVSPNVLILPQGPGSLGGVGENVQTNLNMGVMSYPVSVGLPKGRNGLTPSLDIVYSSAAGSGVMGIGWGLNVGGSVERLTVRGLPTYSSSDKFYGGSGELVQLPNTPFYRARFEGGFVRYRWYPDKESKQKGYWTAEYPNGEKAFFGANSKGEVDTNSQVFGAKGTFRWELRTRIDRNGNRIEYNYFRSGNQVYLERMEWVFNKAGKALYKAELEYETRPDPISDGKPGFDLVTNRRVKSITIFSEGQRIRSYQFTFEVASGLSRLTKVTQFGVDPKIAHAVSYNMTYSEATFSPENSRLVKIPTSVSQDFKSRNSDLIDMNGDGLPDVVDTSKEKHRFHMNVVTLKEGLQQNTHDFPKANIEENPVSLSAKLSNDSVQMLDSNGDGFTDMVDAVNKKIYINKGNKRWEDKSQLLQNFPSIGTDPNMRFFDYNGDKAVDIISSNGTTTTYWVSDQQGSWKQQDGGVGIGASFSTDKVRLIDMNGDGLTDAVQIFGGKLRYKKFFGYGKWSDWINVNVPGLEQSKLDPDRARFADINGDGLADMVAFLGNTIRYFVNRNGISFAEGKELKSFKGVDIPDSTQNSIRIADMNGNGSRDIVWISSSGQVTYLELFSIRPNLLKTISNGIGLKIEVGYGSSVYHRIRDESLGNPWTNKLPMPFVVVNWIKTWAETDGTTKPTVQTQRIYYHDGYYDGKERKFRGFRRVEAVLEGDTSVETRRTLTTYNVGDNDVYFHGKLLQRTVSNDKQHTYSNDTWTWKDCGTLAGTTKDLKPPVRFVCMQSHEKQFVEGVKTKESWKTVRNERTYDAYGNITQFKRLGDKEVDGDEATIKLSYILPNDPLGLDTTWNLRLVQSVEHCGSLSTQCAITNYYYDGPPFEGLPKGQFTKGNVSRATMKRSTDSDEVVTPLRRKYDSYGNVIESKGPKGLLRSVTWDASYHRHPNKETVHLKDGALTASTDWNTQFNVVSKSIGFNGHATFYQYDTFGRLTSMALPGDPADKPSVTYKYDLKAPISRIVVQQRSKTGGPLDRKLTQCRDGRGRSLSRSYGLSSGQYMVLEHQEYNRTGQRARLWNTYQSDKDCSFAGPNDGKITSYHYDGLHRLTKRVLPDSSELRTVYLPLQYKEYDEEDNRKDSPYFDTPKTTLLDGLGRALSITTMPSKGKTIVTKYRYSNTNVKGKSLIAAVVLPDGSEKTHQYDLLGRILKVTGPDRKSITYEYDANSNVTKRTDARGISVVFTYDGIDRLLTKQEEGKDNTRISYLYDKAHTDLPSATNLKARMSRVEYPGGSYLYSYDKRGNMVQTRQTYMGVVFDTQRTFDNEGKVLSETYQDGRKLTFEWDALGRMTSVPSLLPEIEHDPEGMLKRWKGSNGVETTYQFDSRHRIKEVQVNKGEVLGLKYSLDSAGNILSLINKMGSEEYQNTYKYDALYRLQEAKVGQQGETLTYQQDDLYNLTSKVSSIAEKSPVHIGAFQYDEKRIHAVVKAGSTTLSYDASGYMKQRGKWEHRWDFMGRRKETLQNGKTVHKSWYDSGPTRTLKWENGLHTFYLDSDFEIRNGYGVIYGRLGPNRVVAWKSTKILSKFFDDIAPATGEQQLTPSPDGKITSADAFLYHANRTKQLSVTVHSRTPDVDLTDDMLQASLARMFEDPNQPETKVYFHTDHLGSTRAVTDDTGKVTSTTSYYPYGKVRTQSGSSYSYGFMGSELDRGAQVNQFRLRSMDTQLGKWLSPDPVFDQIRGTRDEDNSYGSVLNNPIRFRDLDGGFSTDVVMDNIHWSGIGFAAVALVFDVKDRWKTRRTTYTSHTKLTRAAQSIKVVTGGASTVLVTAASLYTFAKDKDTASALVIAASVSGAINSFANYYVIHKKQQLARVSASAKNRTRLAGLGFAGLRGGLASGALASHVLGESQLATGLAVAGVLAGNVSAFVFTRKGFNAASRSQALRRSLHRLRTEKKARKAVPSLSRHLGGTGATLFKKGMAGSTKKRFRRKR